MTHRMPMRAHLGKRLLATSSVVALVAGVGSAAHAANVTNPASIPNPTVAAGQMATSIVFNDGKTHTGSVVNNGNRAIGCGSDRGWRQRVLLVIEVDMRVDRPGGGAEFRRLGTLGTGFARSLHGYSILLMTPSAAKGALRVLH